ncbi:autophagy-related protein 27 [Scheffersomyces xylosifermentans]|uniref:autophagy-related protein 27 n=1 Tax=Scheffersomyces xylosifermentans TaxID=1304137 RepID=UPI00315C59BE
MLLKQVVAVVTGLSGLSAAIDCSVKELQQYNFEAFKGVHSVISLKDTPPSQTNVTWYFGICEPIKDGTDNCPKNSDICGITSIILDKDPKSTVVSEIVGFNTNLQKTYTPFTKEGKNKDEDGVTISYTGVNWGENLVDAELKFVCAQKSDKEDTLDKFKLEKWDGNKLVVSVRTKTACITADKDKKKPDDKKDPKDPEKPDNGESWGWFTWIFIFLVLFLSIYIIGGAWFQYNKGNAIDFQSALREVLENFVELLKGIPSFSREIIEKFTGHGNRGEYSAV